MYEGRFVRVVFVAEVGVKGEDAVVEYTALDFHFNLDEGEVVIWDPFQLAPVLQYLELCFAEFI